MWSGGIVGQWRVILLGVQETRELGKHNDEY
jgi:hypothetical protein